MCACVYLKSHFPILFAVPNLIMLITNYHHGSWDGTDRTLGQKGWIKLLAKFDYLFIKKAKEKLQKFEFWICNKKPLNLPLFVWLCLNGAVGWFWRLNLSMKAIILLPIRIMICDNNAISHIAQNQTLK